MFNRARIKLTTWYLLIIMLISISFSIGIFKVVTSELDRVERIQRLRSEHRLQDNPFAQPFDSIGETQRTFRLDPELIEETKNRLIIILILINAGILISSALAGYFLAGRTLKPIQEMIDEQNRFVTDASHELRTPLTSLKSEIEVNLRDKKLGIEQAKKLLLSNLEEVNSLQILSDDLIKLTQYQKNGNGLELNNESLELIINEAIKKVSALAKNKNIKIINKTKDYSIEGSKTALIEVFVIFLDNAIKYSPKNTAVNLISEKTDGHIIIEITDEGFGINEKDIPHLFDRFYRVDKSRTKSDIPGYGLGLSIAKQIIEKHNGNIKVKSELKKETTFTIEIPLKHNRGL